MHELKEKLEVTNKFIQELISKSWQDAEALQQQAINIDSSTALGKAVVKLLCDLSTNYYVLIGCLENLLDGNPEALETETVPQVMEEPKPSYEDVNGYATEPDLLPDTAASEYTNFEPFEYFVDFDDPIGDPMSDKDLYGN